MPPCRLAPRSCTRCAGGQPGPTPVPCSPAITLSPVTGVSSEPEVLLSPKTHTCRPEACHAGLCPLRWIFIKHESLSEPYGSVVGSTVILRGTRYFKDMLSETSEGAIAELAPKDEFGSGLHHPWTKHWPRGMNLVASHGWRGGRTPVLRLLEGVDCVGLTLPIRRMSPFQRPYFTNTCRVWATEGGLTGSQDSDPRWPLFSFICRGHIPTDPNGEG